MTIEKIGLTGRKQRLLTSSASIANRQVEPNAEAAFAGANGDPRDWNSDGMRQAGMRAGYQGAQASQLKGKASENDKAFTELFTEMGFGILQNTEVNGLPSTYTITEDDVDYLTSEYGDTVGTEFKADTEIDLQNIARRKLTQNTYNSAYSAAKITARDLFERGVKSAPTADTQAQRAMSLMSGKRDLLANMLCLAQTNLPKAQELMDPALRDIVNGKAASVTKLETRAKKIQSALDVALKIQHSDWKTLIKSEELTQESLNEIRKSLKAYRDGQRESFQLSKVPKDHASQQGFRDELQEVIDAG